MIEFLSSYHGAVFILYWLPLFICVCGYTIRTWINYQKDKRIRDSEEYYYPSDTVGTLIGRVLTSIIPLINVWVVMFDIGPKIVSFLYNFLGKIFDQPLVPKKHKF